MEVGAEVLQHVVDVADDGVIGCLDRASTDGRSVEKRLDRLLVLVGELVAFRVEELDSVVLRWVVRGREDDAEILGEKCDGRGRQHTAEHGNPAGGCDPGHDRFLERRPRAARVAPDEDAAAPAPHRRRAA